MQITINDIIFDSYKLNTVFPNLQNAIKASTCVNKKHSNHSKFVLNFPPDISSNKSDNSRIMRAIQFRINNGYYDSFRANSNCRHNFLSIHEFLSVMKFLTKNPVINQPDILSKEISLIDNEDKEIIGVLGLCSLNN